MSRSEPKPKIIYKNLEDVIKGSSLNKSNSNKKYNSQRTAFQTLADITNGKQSQSMELRKTKFIKMHHRTEADEDRGKEEKLEGTVDIYSKCYNQIDVIFTELQDFFCQSKEKVLEDIRSQLANKIKNKQEGKLSGRRLNQRITEKIEDIKKMSDYIKHIANYFINGQIPDLQEAGPQQMHSSSTKRPTAATKNTMITQQYEDQSAKLLSLSIKNSKVRANRRGQLINNRKKTVYQLILEQQENKIRLATSASKKIL